MKIFKLISIFTVFNLFSFTSKKYNPNLLSKNNHQTSTSILDQLTNKTHTQIPFNQLSQKHHNIFGFSRVGKTETICPSSLKPITKASITDFLKNQSNQKKYKSHNKSITWVQKKFALIQNLCASYPFLRHLALTVSQDIHKEKI